MAALAGPIIIGIVNGNAIEAQYWSCCRRQATRGPVRVYRLSEISVTGVKAPQVNESIRSLLGMGVGDIYDESRHRKAFEDMKRLYGSLGYVNFVLEPTFDFDEARKVVALTIIVTTWTTRSRD